MGLLSSFEAGNNGSPRLRASQPCPRSPESLDMSDPFPEIKSTHSLVAKYVTKPIWDKLSRAVTKTSGFTLAQAIACATEFDNQHCGIYAGDWDSYKVFADVFDPLIQEYHGISADATHTSDMDVNKIKGNVDPAAPVHSCRIRVGRSIDGFGLSPGITKEQRVGVENLMKKAFANLKGDLAGTYFPLTGMDEKVRQQLVDDHFLFVSGDPNLKVAGMERDWPEGRGIFHNKDKTFLTWVNEEDQLRIISMQMGGDVRAVFDRLARGFKAVEDRVRKGLHAGRQVRLHPLLPHQPWNWHEGLSPRRPSRLDQGGPEAPGSSLRGTAPAAQGHQGRVWWPDRHHLRHLQQAQAGILRG